MILDSADQLIYHKGYNAMSFSDLAQQSGVSKGHLYYYFKTKEDVLAAVIDHRLQQMSQMLQSWEETFDDPRARIERFIQILLNESSNVVQYGCPMGSLNTELAKSQAELQRISKHQFELFHEWLSRQFDQLLPASTKKQAEEFAMHLLVRTQGIAVMSQAYGNRKLLAREVEKVKAWLDEVC